MNLIIYFGKVILVSGILYSYYWLALRNKQFHLYNRFYLIITVLISLILPCINISFLNNNSNGAVKVLHVISVSGWEDAVIITPHRNWLYHFLNWQDILFAFFIIISCVMIFILTKTIYDILKIKKNYTWENIDDIKLFYTHEPQSPFSFFKNIFWNEELDISSSAGNQILRHEIYHVRKNHSFDILFLEMIKCIFWFNPFFFLIKKEIKVIHEFLADQYAASGSDKYSYAELLVWQTVNTKQINIINTFFHNQIKRRIAMITQLKNKRYYYLSRVMVLPVLFILFCAFALKPVTKRINANHPNSIFQKTDSAMPGYTEIPIENIEKIEVTGKAVLLYRKDNTIQELKRTGIKDVNTPKWNIDISKIKKIEYDEASFFCFKTDGSTDIAILNANSPELQSRNDTDIVFTKVEVESTYPGGQQGWTNYLMNSFKYPEKAIKKQIQGTVVIKYIVDKDGNISNVVAESGPMEGGLREEAIRVIKNSGKWVPAMQNGRKVRAYKRQPIVFKLQEK